MKLKLVATLKKEALLPGMEQAVQNITNPPAIVQQMNMSDETAKNQLMAKYKRGIPWDAGDAGELEKDIKSYMEKFHAGKPYGIGVAEPNLNNDQMRQREDAIQDGRAKIALDGVKVVSTQLSVAARLFFTDTDRNVYVLVY